MYFKRRLDRDTTCQLRQVTNPNAGTAYLQALILS